MEYKDNVLNFATNEERLKYFKKQLPAVNVALITSQEDNEEAWLAQRTKGIGGSDVGAICGMSQFECARGIYLRKTNQYPEEELSDFQKDLFHFGHQLESVVATEYAIRTGARLIEAGVSFSNKIAPWKLTNVDRFILDDEDNIVGILEVKTTTEFNNNKWKEGEIPLAYLAQLNWYLHVCDLKYGAICVLVGGNKFYEFSVIRNDNWLDEVILPTVNTFWDDNVVLMREPALDGSDAAADLVKKLYPARNAIEDTAVLDDSDTAALMEHLADAKLRIKELDKVKNQCESILKDRIGDKIYAETINGSYTWKPQSQTRVDTAVLKKDYPEVYAKCTKITTFKKLSVKIDKED